MYHKPSKTERGPRVKLKRKLVGHIDADKEDVCSIYLYIDTVSACLQKHDKACMDVCKAQSCVWVLFPAILH